MALCSAPVSEFGREDKPGGIQILLCRNAEMLAKAQRLRYQVYCRELGRNSPSAQHRQGKIADALDAFGHTFIAIRDTEVIGTVRANYARECSLGIFEKLYGMSLSAHHPEATVICTKLIVKSRHRGGPTALKLISRLVQRGLRSGIKECYIDSVPSLVDYYQAMGFEIAGEEFFHPENGPSFPMRLDLVEHGEVMSGEAGIRWMRKRYVHAMRQKALSTGYQNVASWQRDRASI